MKRVLIAILLLIAGHSLYAQESIDPGRKPRHEHYEVDTADAVPTSFEHFKRYEVEIGRGVNYAQTPGDALSSTQSRGKAVISDLLVMLRLSYYFTHRFSVGLYADENKLAYIYTYYGNSADHKIVFANPATSFNIFCRYSFGKLYLAASAGYISLKDYNKAADITPSPGSPKFKDATGFTPGLQIGYKYPLSQTFTLFAELGVKGIFTDVCKGSYYTGISGVSVKFKKRTVIHSD